MNENPTKPGIHNWRNLFKKPTLNDWIQIILLGLLGYLVWSYQHDINALQQVIDDCYQRCIQHKGVNGFDGLNFVVEI
jgi:hypothetical protein|tara:strand:+ start:519 stop:752 length:234 start_codon:yes stop_codon:yes gene_type:complete